MKWLERKELSNFLVIKELKPGNEMTKVKLSVYTQL